MIVTKDVFMNMLNSPIRHLRGRVEVFQGSTLALICGCHDRLIEFKVERTGEKNKVFGYGICQKLTTTLLDRNRELDINKSHSLEVEFGVGSDYVYPYPSFHVEEVKRDENNNNLTITAYDALYRASAHTVSELVLEKSYTLKQFAEACAALLGIPLKQIDDVSFNTYYEGKANFEGTETIREALDDIAEATQTIYFINHNWELVFKKLDKISEPVVTVDKTKYFTLKNNGSVSIATITHATELGDNLTATTGEEGVTQYIRNNAFWELREDTAQLVDNALAAVAGLTLEKFDCEWRGNYLIEIGDKVAFTTKDDNTIISYILDDTVEFNGSLKGKTRWAFEEDKAETASNPTSLGDVIKQTYAKVDKTNKQIELVASEVSANKSEISSLITNTNSISASVSKIETETKQKTDTLNDELTSLKSSVEAQITADDVTLQIKKELEQGVNKVVTGKNFVFDDSGLTVEDLNEDNIAIKTTVSNNGMTVYSDNTEVLTANDKGVKAKDLHATTFLIIGNNSRFEDYSSSRTGCFWIGG